MKEFLCETKRCLLLAAQCIVALASATAAGQVLFAESGVVFDETSLGVVERSLTVTAGGAYDLALRDLAAPAAFSNVRAAIIRGTTVVGTVELVNGAPGPAVRRVDLDPATYIVRVIGRPRPNDRAGSVAVEVVRASDSVSVLQFNEAVSLGPPAIPDNTRIFEMSFEVTDASLHDLTLVDLGFPQAAQSLSLLLTRGSSVVGGPLVGPGTLRFPGQPRLAGDPPYTVRLILTAATAAAGALAQVRVRNAAGALVVDETVTAGRVRAVAASNLGAGSHTLRLTDLAVPSGLGTLRAIGIRDGVEVVRLGIPGTVDFDAQPGSHRFFVQAVPAAEPGSGAFAVAVARGGEDVLVAAEAVNVGTPAAPVFAYPVDVPTAGSYSLRLTDFQFPNALADVRAVAIQGSAPLALLQAPGTASLASLRAGRLFVLAAARPGGTSGGSLFGLELLPASGGDAAFEITQGVGALFRPRRFDVAAAGRYDVSLRDLAFPANFVELFAVVTRGPDRVGSIFGGGTFSVQATPGRYFVNFVGRPDVAENAGSYAISVAPSPPPPTVTLTSGATTVLAGGTVTLTWSSQNATDCTASGGWTGSRGTSGSETTAAINAATTFTLTCSGGGGSASASVTVSVTAPPPGGASGGGGRLDGALLGSLLLLWMGHLRRAARRREISPFARFAAGIRHGGYDRAATLPPWRVSRCAIGVAGEIPCGARPVDRSREARACTLRPIHCGAHPDPDIVRGHLQHAAAAHRCLPQALVHDEAAYCGGGSLRC